MIADQSQSFVIDIGVEGRSIEIIDDMSACERNDVRSDVGERERGVNPLDRRFCTIQWLDRRKFVDNSLGTEILQRNDFAPLRSPVLDRARLPNQETQINLIARLRSEHRRLDPEIMCRGYA